jgi:thiol:disulfide interchange protein
MATVAAALAIAAVVGAGIGARAQSADDAADSGATTGGATAEHKISWRDDARAAMAAGRQSGKLVLFDVGASWCPNCKKMQETTYTDPNVCNELNQHFICVALDKDDGGDGTKLADALIILATPTILIVDPQTDKYMMKVGYQDATKFAAMLDKVEKRGLRSGTAGFRLTPKIYGNR